MTPRQALRHRAARSSVSGAAAIGEVMAFWRLSTRHWFAKNATFDRHFRERFLALHEEVAARQHDDWIEMPEGALALLILADQFPRNAFRGTSRMYATDPLALDYARQALETGYMEWVEPDMRLFFCLPFAHSEALSDQDISVGLNARLGQPWLDHAEGHRGVIRRFGRFPHRNPILGRATSADEAAFLRDGGFSG